MSDAGSVTFMQKMNGLGRRQAISRHVHARIDFIAVYSNKGATNMKLFFVFCFIFSTSLFFSASAAETVTTVEVKINESVSSDARATKYDEPLDAALKEAKVGEVTGGGNSLGKSGKIEWAGLDIEINDVQKGIPLIKQKLLELGAPKGSSLEYKVGAKKVVVPIQ
jgi:hypothetical protein